MAITTVAQAVAAGKAAAANPTSAQSNVIAALNKAGSSSTKTSTPATVSGTPVNTSTPSPKTVTINPPNSSTPTTTTPTWQQTLADVQANTPKTQTPTNVSGVGQSINPSLKGTPVAPVTTTSTPVNPATTNDLQKYKDTLAKLSTTQAPTSQGLAQTTIGEAMPTTEQYNPAQADAVLADNKAHQQYLTDYSQSQNSLAQQKSLTQTYTDLTNQLGIPELNTELMNMNNVINGTEQDIRDEVTKAGGFATNSQVLALTDARNKTLLQNYNNLLQTRDDAVKNLNTMMQLTEQDRTYAQQQIDNTLNFDQQNIDYADKALTNAQDALKTIQSSEGWDGIYKAALATGDPQAIDKINSTMGNGFDLKTMATQDAQARAQAAQDTALKNAQLQATIANTKATTAKTQAETQALKDKALEDSGAPNPAKANAPGYDAQGVKYTIQSAAQEVVNYWVQTKAQDKNGFVTPAVYNDALAKWVANGLSSSDFKAEFGGYANPDDVKNKLINN